MERARIEIAEEAADWLVRLDEDPSGSCQAEFVAWLKRSPTHLDEFLLVETTYRTIENHYPRDRVDWEKLMRGVSAQVLPLTAKSTPAAKSKQPKSVLVGLAAALGAVVIAAAVMLWPSMALKEYETTLGEQSVFKLPDGSRLTLNTGSKVQIDFSQSLRQVQLVRGEALFSVKSDAARPFIVSTDSAQIRVLGTVFNVYRRADQTTAVSVVDGKVQVESVTASEGNTQLPSPTAASTVSAGEQVRVSKTTGVTRLATTDVGQALAWQQRRLVFRGTPLAEVIVEFNRYNADLQLRLVDAPLGARRITGTFDADEPRAFVKFLRDDATVQLNEAGRTVAITAK